MKPTVVYQPLSKIGYVHVTFACFIYSALHIVFSLEGARPDFWIFARETIFKRGEDLSETMVLQLIQNTGKHWNS